MKKTISVTEAVQKVWDVALANRIPGEQYDVKQTLDAEALPYQGLGAGFSLRWERGWGIDARLSVRSTVRDGRVVLALGMSWSSGELSAHVAMAAANLHSQVASLACWMQSVIDSLPEIKAE